MNIVLFGLMSDILFLKNEIQIESNDKKLLTEIY